MVHTSAGDKNIFCQVEQIYIEDMQVQVLGYFEMLGIVNVNAGLPFPLLVPDLQNMANNQQEI